MEDWCVERYREDIEKEAFKLSQRPDRQHLTAHDNFLRAIEIVKEKNGIWSLYNRIGNE